MDDLFVPLTPDNPGAPGPRKCLHPRKYRSRLLTGGSECLRCGRTFDAAVSRRGRNSRSRGNREELIVARQIGGHKVGPLGHPWDVVIPGYMKLQVKKLARWPSLAIVVTWMDAMGISPEMRGVAVVQPGRGGRRLLVLDLDEFARWHGDPTTGMPAEDVTA